LIRRVSRPRRPRRRSDALAGTSAARPERARDEEGLDEQAPEALGVGVHAEPVAVVQPLVDVAREDRDEEAREDRADAALLLRKHDERGAQHDLDGARHHDDAVLVDLRDLGRPLGHLVLELAPAPEEVAESREHHSRRKQPSQCRAHG
jgi:hypothetical protein